MFFKILITILVAMVPLIELRGAIPIAVAMGVPEPLALFLAVVGNMLPVPFIYLFSRRILVWGQDKPYIGKFFDWCLRKGEKTGKKLTKKAGQSVFLALFLFVGIPLPGTGAWTGTLAASILNLDFKPTITAVMCGIALAGVIMLAVSFGVFGLIF